MHINLGVFYFQGFIAPILIFVSVLSPVSIFYLYPSMKNGIHISTLLRPEMYKCEEKTTSNFIYTTINIFSSYYPLRYKSENSLLNYI